MVAQRKPVASSLVAGTPPVILQRKVADALGDLARAELQPDRKRAPARAASGTDLACEAAKGKGDHSRDREDAAELTMD